MSSQVCLVQKSDLYNFYLFQIPHTPALCNRVLSFNLLPTASRLTPHFFSYICGSSLLMNNKTVRAERYYIGTRLACKHVFHIITSHSPLVYFFWPWLFSLLPVWLNFLTSTLVPIWPICSRSYILLLPRTTNSALIFFCHIEQNSNLLLGSVRFLFFFRWTIRLFITQKSNLI